MGIQRPAQSASQLLGKVPSVQPFLGQQMVFISLKVVWARSEQDWPVAGGWRWRDQHSWHVRSCMSWQHMAFDGGSLSQVRGSEAP